VSSGREGSLSLEAPDPDESGEALAISLQAAGECP
jgi:hypothetical protein